MNDRNSQQTAESFPLSLDFSECEREVLDRTGRLQAQGALLLLDAELKPLACSENWNSLTQRPLTRFDTPYDLSTLLGPDPDDLNTLQNWDEQPRSLPIVNAPGGTELWGCRRGELFQLEWLQLNQNTQAELAAPSNQELSEVNAYEASQRVADHVRTVLGLDRVMIYKFDHDYAGDVIAEARRTDWEPFLGLHYPATDIPQIARQMYLRIRLRSIHDAYLGSVPLLTRKGLKAHDIDLTGSSLRSVSPYHLEYLRNMGVRATVSAAIVVDGKLWGLIACHHGSPLVLSLAARQYLQQSAEALAASVEATEAALETRNRQALDETFSELRKLLIGRLNLTDAQLLEHLLLGHYSLTAMTRSQGAVLYADGTLVGSGPHPPLDWVQRFVESFLTLQPDGIFMSDRISADCPVPLPPEAPVSGLLAIVLYREPRVVALVFRQPYLKEIHWGGDPGRPAEPNEQGRLSPRRSFHLWKETVLDQSKPWQQLEKNFLLGLRILLQENFAATELCGRILRGSLALTAQMVEHSYIARAITSGSQHGLVMTTVETGDQPATLLQLNQNLQELFELSPDRLRTGETVSYFLSRLGLVNQGSDNSNTSNNSLPERISIWSPVLGHRNLKIARQTLLSVEKANERHALVSLQFHDHTGEERLTNALRSAIERSEAANEAKTRFLANTSHELKTPLHAILGFQGLMDLELTDSSASPSDDLKLYSEQIGQASRHMLNLVDQLLFFSKSTRAGLRLPVSTLELDKLIAETVSWLRYGAGLRQLSITTQLSEGLKADVNDQTIRQLLSNLLSNAIKFSQPGGDILCRLSKDELANNAELEVSDTGLGMSEQDIAHAFEPFYQGQHQSEGSGIGLSLVKAIAEAHGGRVGLSSRLGQGTRVTVYLPLTHSEHEIEIKVVQASK